MKYITLILAASLLSACSNGERGASKKAPVKEYVSLVPTQSDIDYADAAVPADPLLAEIYGRSCAGCHALEGMGAPLTGHAVDWKDRYSKRGADGLLLSTKVGREGMPAMGLCADCSDEDFTKLIEYMAERQ